MPQSGTRMVGAELGGAVPSRTALAASAVRRLGAYCASVGCTVGLCHCVLPFSQRRAQSAMRKLALSSTSPYLLRI